MRVRRPLPPAKRKTRENGFFRLREVLIPMRVRRPLPPAKRKTRENGFFRLREVLIPHAGYVVLCPQPNEKPVKTGF